MSHVFALIPEKRIIYDEDNETIKIKNHGFVFRKISGDEIEEKESPSGIILLDTKASIYQLRELKRICAVFSGLFEMQVSVNEVDIFVTDIKNFPCIVGFAGCLYALLAPYSVDNDRCQVCQEKRKKQ